jgi:CheY-like chemotaxis protein
MAEPVSTRLRAMQSHSDPARTAENDAANVWSGTPRLDGVRVLLVEGAPQFREVVADVLGQCGAHVTAVDSAVAGLASLKRERPDALLSSLSMPEKDGYWLIREVRKLPPDQGGDVPAAVITGLTTTEHRLATLRAGYQFHVAKPVALSRLAEVVALLTLKSPGAGELRATLALSPGGRL